MAPLSLVEPAGRYLTLPEREEISILHAAGSGVRAIARALGRSPSTVSRELRRNAATRGGALVYRAHVAQWKAEQYARRPRPGKLVGNDALRRYVCDRLEGRVLRPDGTPAAAPATSPWKGRRHGQRKDRRWTTAWSPEQIAHRLPIDHPHDPSMRISHEAIYQALFIENRGGLRREMTESLRTGRSLRVPRARTKRGKTFITDDVRLDQRPAAATDRVEVGHWEGDLILGLGGTAIGTLVERTTRYTLLLHLPPHDGHPMSGPKVKNGPPTAGHGAEAVREAIAAALAGLPAKMRRSLTWDQGAELAQHAWLTAEHQLPVFFCDPHSPWQRPTNENTNGLARQYFPKGTDLSRYAREDLDAVAGVLNARPRKCLEWRTPTELFTQHLDSPQATGVASVG